MAGYRCWRYDKPKLDRSNPKNRASVVEVAGQTFRLSPWYGRSGAVLLGVPPHLWMKERVWIDRARLAAAGKGYKGFLVQATSANQRDTLEGYGFRMVDQLFVLFRSLARPLPDVDRPLWDLRLRRAREVDVSSVIEVDNRCFDTFWMMNTSALTEATMATPRSRFRVLTAGDQEQVIGYAIFGLGAGEGYLQRIAVDPEWRGRGLGTLMIADGLRWAKRWRARRVGVNTQQSNRSALQLYIKLGFELEPEGIAIYSWEDR